MLALVVALLILAAFMLFSRWFAATSPTVVLRSAKWAGVAALLSLSLLLALTGRLGWVLALLAGAVPWGMRVLQTHSLYRSLRAVWVRKQQAEAATGGSSKVETRFLSMSLDHASGYMDGIVLRGDLRGRQLSHLTKEELARMHMLCAADPQSLQLLEAWCQRMRPEWGEWWDDGESTADGRQASSASMSHEEALAILGLQPGASIDEIKAAHRRLMAAVHPDRGGSTYLAARINQAKDVLSAS